MADSDLEWRFGQLALDDPCSLALEKVILPPVGDPAHLRRPPRDPLGAPNPLYIHEDRPSGGSNPLYYPRT